MIITLKVRSLRQEQLDLFAALAAGRVFDARVGVDSGRAYFQNRSLDVLRRESAGENDRAIGKLHQAPTRNDFDSQDRRHSCRSRNFRITPL